MAGHRGAGRQSLELTPDQLRRTTDPARLGFETTRDLPKPPHMVGQARAQEAIEFALEMLDSRYNLFVAGHPGSGRQTAVMVGLESVSRTRSTPQDWCYVYNFDQPDEPCAIKLPPGQGRAFAHDIEALVLAYRRELRRVFLSETYSRERKEALRDVVARNRALQETLEADARRLGFGLEETQTGIALVPLKPVPGETAFEHAEPYAREEFDALPTPVREEYDRNRERVRDLADRIFAQAAVLREEARGLVRKLDREKGEAVLRPRVEALMRTYAGAEDAAEYLRALDRDLLTNVQELRGEGEDAGDLGSEPGEAEERPESSVGGDEGAEAALGGMLRRYRVNVLVGHKPQSGAPVVHEINPTRSNLLGRIEEGRRGNGLPYADHLMIKPGALHRANGGFLILQATDVLKAHSYDILKRVMRFEMVTFDGAEPSGPGSSLLRPQPIPASVRVILIGDESTYGLLLEADPEFRQLFKVRADFDSEMPRNREGEIAYAHYVGDVARTTGGAPLDATAVALIVEEGSRWAGDQEKLSALFGDLRDLTMEACHWAAKESSSVTSRRHVARAIVMQERRVSLVSDKLEEQIEQGTVQIATDGAVVGQINGLTVIPYHDFVFGNPSRITARTSPGQVGLVDVEREIGASGPIHSKGVLILNGYLQGRYAQRFPLSLSATLTFEQVYVGVDGDSASSAELCALLSSLSGVALKQSLAVTGSVNQMGEIQAVGGVSYKVEAFFRICRSRGLTGQQGAILPRANMRNLMLRDDVIEAVRAGAFHLYAVNSIDEVMELLTDMPAGQADRRGEFPDNSINGKVMATLRTYTGRVRAYAPAPTGVLRRRT